MTREQRKAGRESMAVMWPRVVEGKKVATVRDCEREWVGHQEKEEQEGKDRDYKVFV